MMDHASPTITADLRKPDVHRHQRYKHTTRTRKCHNNRVLYSSAGVAKKRRRVARSYKRDQLTNTEYDLKANMNEYNELLFEDWQQEWTEILYIRKQCSEIYDAIDGDDAELLDYLVPPVNIFTGATTDWLDPTGDKFDTETILVRAFRLERTECIRILLEKIDCDTLNQMILDHETLADYLVLRHACKTGNLNLVQRLVEHCHANIHQWGLLKIAVEMDHETIVDYLLDKGCDPHWERLHDACRSGCLNIVKILLKYGADPWALDHQYQTALHLAICHGHAEIATTLIFHQNGRFVKNISFFTPLMLAVDRNLTSIVSLLFATLPCEQVFDELTLLACRYTIEGDAHNRNKLYDFYKFNLSIRKPPPDPTVYEAYEFRRECETLDELEFIRDDDNAMRMNALLVSERLSCRTGEIYAHLQLITKQSYEYVANELEYRSFQLLLHGSRLAKRVEDPSQALLWWYKRNLAELVDTMCSMLDQYGTIPVESLAILFIWVLERTDNTRSNSSLRRLLAIVTYMLETKQATTNEQRILFSLVRQLVQKEGITFDDYPPLSFYVQKIAANINIQYCIYSSLSTLLFVRLLIQCGADANEISQYTKDRPLHIIARCSNVDAARPVIRLLLDAGAHLDCIDGGGCLPEDRARAFEVQTFLRAQRKLSLKCRCAQLIVLRKINIEKYLSSNLLTFVRMHNNTVDKAKIQCRLFTDRCSMIDYQMPDTVDSDNESNQS